MIIEVRGKCAPQGSKRHVGNGRMVEMSKAVGPWREAVRAETQLVCQARHSASMSAPVDVCITFLLSRPRSHYGTGRNKHLLKPSAPGWPAGRPDLDKLARAVLDGLTMGGAWKDDSQVIALRLLKIYSEPGEYPGCVITIMEAE